MTLETSSNLGSSDTSPSGYTSAQGRCWLLPSSTQGKGAGGRKGSGHEQTNFSLGHNGGTYRRQEDEMSSLADDGNGIVVPLTTLKGAGRGLTVIRGGASTTKNAGFVDVVSFNNIRAKYLRERTDTTLSRPYRVSCLPDREATTVLSSTTTTTTPIALTPSTAAMKSGGIGGGERRTFGGGTTTTPNTGTLLMSTLSAKSWGRG